MTAWVALLRAVNLGPHQKLLMADLRSVLEELGLRNVRTLVQTGNALFDSDDDEAALSARLRAAVAERLNLNTPHLLRTAAEWRALVEANPMPQQAVDSPSRLLLMALERTPEPGSIERLREAITGPEAAQLVGRDLYVHYPADIGHSKVTSALIERKLGVTGTARNWNTVLKIAAAFG